MPIIQANVPQAHLATGMGNPNELLVEYSTDLLLPVAGPYLLTQLRRDFVRALMLLNDFLAFVEDARTYLASGAEIALPPKAANLVYPTTRNASTYGREITPVAQAALTGDLYRPGLAGKMGARSKDAGIPIRESLLARLAAPNLVFREMLEAGLLQRTPRLLAPGLAKAPTFSARAVLVLQALLRPRQQHVPPAVAATMRALATQAIDTAALKHSGYLRLDFEALPRQTWNLLVQWMVAYHLSIARAVPAPFAVDLSPTLGFGPSMFVQEWALNRRERLRLAFGTPDLRGPLAAEPVAPRGTFRREDYSATQNELTLLTAESRRSGTTEALSLSAGNLRRELDSVYYSGSGGLNQLTSQASNALLTEDRRQVVLTIIREVSEARENMALDITSRITSSTVTREAVGVDQKLAATHHRFRVVVPVTATVEMHDVGLTWSPRVSNPFFALRQAIHAAYETAYRSHLHQYYVPEPVSPPIVWERYVVSTDRKIKKANELVVERDFEIQLPPSDRQDYPDFGSWTVVWNQSESWDNDDPDHFSAGLKDPSFSGGTIRGTVRLETDDGGSDWQGFAHIEVPVLRYSQDTINALAQHELAMQDYNLKRQALEAQAHQFARIREREFIERHEAREPLLKLVFYELIRRICVPWLASQVSYYKEILWRCIDWKHAKIDLEPAKLDALAYPDFEADHFVNSLWVRLFLPINKGAETNFFDALTACGTFQVRASVTAALNHVDAIRTRLQQNGPDQIDQFTTEMIIGDHIEAVMSAREMAT